MVAAPTSRHEALEIAHGVQSDTADRVAVATERIVIKESHDVDPLLNQRLDHYRYGQLWTGYSGADFWNLHDHLVAEEPNGGPVTIQLRNQVKRGASDDPAVRMAAFILRTAAGEIAPSTSMVILPKEDKTHLHGDSRVSCTERRASESTVRPGSLCRPLLTSRRRIRRAP